MRILIELDCNEAQAELLKRKLTDFLNSKGELGYDGHCFSVAIIKDYAPGTLQASIRSSKPIQDIIQDVILTEEFWEEFWKKQIAEHFDLEALQRKGLITNGNDTTGKD